ncbi:hypothetical protein [Streptomyces sp. AGS-58]|uniref:hypothetical protein n=1 Tax=unclassified Streptomyces TaxID=2593676 RepID=UPI0035A380A0
MPLHPTPCEPWPFSPGCCSLPEDTPQEKIDKWRRVATNLLWALSGRRWGPLCPITVRPCRRSCLDEYAGTVRWGGTGLYVPYLGRDGLWRNASTCGCKSDCSCTELCEVRLDGPVHDIVSVTIGGEALDPAAYRVDNGDLLVRTDGRWPDCQDMSAPCGETGSFCVTYRVGLPLDEAAIAAFSALVCHLVKGCGGSSCGCSLQRNRNVSRVSRQGVDLEFQDTTAMYADMRTGLPEVDAWLVAVNPYRQPSVSRVWSVDYRRPRITTNP